MNKDIVITAMSRNYLNGERFTLVNQEVHAAAFAELAKVPNSQVFRGVTVIDGKNTLCLVAHLFNISLYRDKVKEIIDARGLISSEEYPNFALAINKYHFLAIHCETVNLVGQL